MPHPFVDFYRGKRVLVSGHTSFAGGWLAAWLKLLGAQVCGYGLPPSARPNFFDATLLDRGMTSIFGDLRNREALANTFRRLPARNRDSLRHPGLRPARESRPRGRFRQQRDGHGTYSGRSAPDRLRPRRSDREQRPMLRKSHWSLGPWRTKTRSAGGEFLSSTAACAELAASAYIGEFFHDSKTAVATARTGNVIGGGDWAEGGLVPEIVRGITSRKADCNRGILRAARCGSTFSSRCAPIFCWRKNCSSTDRDFPDAWNFAPHDEDAMTARKLAEKVVERWGRGDLVFGGRRRLASAARVLRLNTHKAHTQLGWKPALSLDDAIAWTVEWYKAFYADPASSWRTTEEQIQRYMGSPRGSA